MKRIFRAEIGVDEDGNNRFQIKEVTTRTLHTGIRQSAEICTHDALAILQQMEQKELQLAQNRTLEFSAEVPDALRAPAETGNPDYRDDVRAEDFIASQMAKTPELMEA